jgi:hypothetical protein
MSFINLPFNELVCDTIWDKSNIEYLSDGTIFQEYPKGDGTFYTIQTNAMCCNVLREKLINDGTTLPNNVSPNNIYFDLDNQKCRWSQPLETKPSNANTPIKIILNPVGNDGAFFTLTENNECDLKISFKYLFKFTCESLTNLTVSSANPNNELKVLRQEKFKLESDLLDINNQISYLSLESVDLYYSIVCNEFPISQGAVATPVETITETQKLPFSNTGFGSLTNTTDLSVANTEVAPIYITKTVNFCLTETGLITWRGIIGDNKYFDFIDGDPNSYTCLDVIEIDKQNKEAILNNQTILIFECTTPFGEKTKVLNQIPELSALQKETTAKILDVNNQIALNIEQNDTICSTILGQFESIFASVTIDKIDDNDKVSTFFDAELFSIPQSQNLYQYLTTTSDSGFFVCGEPSNSETWASGCTSLIYPEFTKDVLSVNPLSNEINVSSCLTIVKDKLYTELFEQSGETDETSFNQSLSPYSFSSNWKSYEYTIPASATTSIINNRIKLNIILNNSCGNLCVLVDQINMTKICKDDDRPNIFYSQSPGFNITKIIDNKKSWIDVTDYTERNFSIANTEGLNHIRQTEYDLNDERLILNSKEIDLTMNMASAVENDVWFYLVNNPTLLSGTTNLTPCVPTCGVNGIIISALTTTNVSSANTLETFDGILISELTDAKNRKILSAYPTLKAVYDRYINSKEYGLLASNEFDYYKMDKFTGLIKSYWDDLIEQVVPATTLWGSVKVYGNTIFDQQKFKYKSYTTILCNNSLNVVVPPSPINGYQGQCQTVEVIVKNIIVFSGLSKSNTQTYNKVCLKQMNWGSEFIGNVNIQDGSGSSINNDGFCNTL